MNDSVGKTLDKTTFAHVREWQKQFCQVWRDADLVVRFVLESAECRQFTSSCPGTGARVHRRNRRTAPPGSFGSEL